MYAVHVLRNPVTCLQELAPYEAKAQQAFNRISADSKGAAYQSWLGFYNSSARKLKWSSAQLVQQANLFSATIGESLGNMLSYAWTIGSFWCHPMSLLALHMHVPKRVVCTDPLFSFTRKHRMCCACVHFSKSCN